MPRFVARERLAAAIAVNAAYTQFAVFAGPAIAGWILVKHGVAAAFATNVAGYLVYFITTAFLVTPEGFVQAKAPRRSVRDDLVEGARYMVGHRGIAALLLLVLVGDAVMSAVYQMMPAYAALLLGTGVGGASALYGAAGIGATLSALWLAHGGAGRATPDRVLWAMLGLSVALLALASAVGLAMALAATLLLGFMSELRRTTTVSILQISIDDSRRGRVMSTQFLVQRLASAAGIALVGASAEVVGLRLPLLAAALVSAAAWLVAARRRTMIRAAFLPAEDPA
jgi:MFS family permease